MELAGSRTPYLALAAAGCLLAAVLALPQVFRDSEPPASGARAEPPTAEISSASTPRELALQVVAHLQAGDREGFCRAALSLDSMARLMAATGESEREIGHMRSHFTEDGQDLLQARAGQAFDDIRRHLDPADLALEEAEFHVRVERTLKVCDPLVVTVRSKGQVVPIYFQGAVETEDGWKLYIYEAVQVGGRQPPSARLRANEVAAIATLRNICSAQAQFQACARADVDQDGIGEFGAFRELSGAMPVRGDPAAGAINPPVLSRAFRQTDDRGEITRSGYHFAIYLPGPEGEGVPADAAGFSLVAADHAEACFCAYAWPVDHAATGLRTFMLNQAGDVVATDFEGYSGAVGPAPEAAFLPATEEDPARLRAPGSILGYQAIGAEGRDGRTWRPVN